LFPPFNSDFLLTFSAFFDINSRAKLASSSDGRSLQNKLHFASPATPKLTGALLTEQTPPIVTALIGVLIEKTHDYVEV
jgi:hypothetical protein